MTTAKQCAEMRKSAMRSVVTVVDMLALLDSYEAAMRALRHAAYRTHKFSDGCSACSGLNAILQYDALCQYDGEAG